jgi:hypothetical protein
LAVLQPSQDEQHERRGGGDEEPADRHREPRERMRRSITRRDRRCRREPDRAGPAHDPSYVDRQLDGSGSGADGRRLTGDSVGRPLRSHGCEQRSGCCHR